VRVPHWTTHIPGVRYRLLPRALFSVAGVLTPTNSVKILFLRYYQLLYSHITP